MELLILMGGLTLIFSKFES